MEVLPDLFELLFGTSKPNWRLKLDQHMERLERESRLSQEEINRLFDAVQELGIFNNF